MSTTGNNSDSRFTTTIEERAEAASLRKNEIEVSPDRERSGISLPRKVVIDEDATQKYVIVRAEHPQTDEQVYFIRGSESAQ
jgi:hypothetical protein